MNILKEIAPLASDLATGRSSIENELDPTEMAEFCATCPSTTSTVTTNAQAHDRKKSKATQVSKAAQAREKKSKGAFAVLF